MSVARSSRPACTNASPTGAQQCTGLGQQQRQRKSRHFAQPAQGAGAAQEKADQQTAEGGSCGERGA